MSEETVEQEVTGSGEGEVAESQEVPATRMSGIPAGLLGQGGLFQALLGSALADQAPAGEGAPAASAGLLDGLGPLMGKAVEGLASNLELPGETAGVAVDLVLGRLLAGRPAEETAQPEAGERLDAGMLLGLLGGAKDAEPDAEQTTGLVQELVARTGLDADTALEAVQQVLAILAGKEPPKPAKKKRKTSKTAKKSAAKKKTAKKPAAKTTAKKKTAKKSTAKKSTAKKPAAKTTAKKSTAKKSAAKTTTKESTAKKPATKTTAKETAKKPAAKTTAKETAKKPAAKTTAKRKTTTKS